MRVNSEGMQKPLRPNTKIRLAALTGTPLRMKSVPPVDISTLEYHRSDHIPQLMEPPEPNVEKDAEFISQQSASRKCVYTYEDKYTFARILVADALVFDSHFESGNLHSAFRVIPEDVKLPRNRHIYDLYMHNDLYTNGHTQWFYFSVANVRFGDEVTFNIKNFAKPDSLFNMGMRPLLYSKKSGKGWVRAGTNIAYFATASSGPASAFTQAPQPQAQPPAPANSQPQSAASGDGQQQPQQQQQQGQGPHQDATGAGATVQGEEPSKKKKAAATTTATNYTLSFTHTFDINDDVCYFAYCHPYTFTDLQSYLFKLQADPGRSKTFKRSLLCKTLAGNICDVLTITGPCTTADILLSKVVIVLTARVHPGESNASWIMQGMIDFLTSDSFEALQLRERFIFKVIPMLNPDGVINGNYRCSLAGCDLNRKWSNPDRAKHPTIFHTKEMVRRVKRHWPVALVIDIHGHSRKQGAFFYGCVPDRKHMRPASPPYILSTRDQQSGDADTTKDVAALRTFFSALDSCSFPAPSPTVYHLDGITPEQTAAPASWTISNDPLRNPILPTKSVSLRDVVAWRVKLLPRVLDATVPIFSFDSCSFKMHKAKASTMRMVAFTELGVDCVYTIEASLAGKHPYHFGAGDLINLGRDMCSGLLTIYPALAVRSSPLYEVPVSILSTSSSSSSSSSSAATLSSFTYEMSLWKQLYSIESSAGSGASLLSESGLLDVTANDEGTGGGNDDSDKDSMEPPPPPGDSTKSTGKKSKSGKSSKAKDNKEDGKDGKPWKGKKSSKADRAANYVGDISWTDGSGIAFPGFGAPLSQKKVEAKVQVLAAGDFKTSASLGQPPLFVAQGRTMALAASDTTAHKTGTLLGAAELSPFALPSKVLSSYQQQGSNHHKAAESLMMQGLGQYRVAQRAESPLVQKKIPADEQLQIQVVRALISSPVSVKAGKSKTAGTSSPVLAAAAATTQAQPHDNVVRIPTATPPFPLALSFTRLNMRPSSALPLTASPDRQAEHDASILTPGGPVDLSPAFFPPKTSPDFAARKKLASPLERSAFAAVAMAASPPAAEHAPPRTLRTPKRRTDVDALGANGLPMQNGNIVIASPTAHSPPTLDDTEAPSAARFGHPARIATGASTAVRRAVKKSVSRGAETR